MTTRVNDVYKMCKKGGSGFHLELRHPGTGEVIHLYDQALVQYLKRAESDREELLKVKAFFRQLLK